MSNKIIKFETPDCNFCKMVDNVLNANEVKAEKINPFDNPDLAVKHEVGSVPVTVLVDEEGNEIMKSYGFKPQELEEIISKLN